MEFERKKAAKTGAKVLANKFADGIEGVIALGGGTGNEIAVKILKTLPITFPKLLITTLPFDPRTALSDSSIILMPTLADIAGLNNTLRQVFDQSVNIIIALTQYKDNNSVSAQTSAVAITALGVTQAATDTLICGLATHGFEATIFHANGYGGTALAVLLKKTPLRG